MADNVITKRRDPSDLIKHEESQVVCRQSAILENNSATALTAAHDGLFQPVKLVAGKWNFVLATDEANAEGLYIGDLNADLAAAADSEFPEAAINRGPAAINRDVIPTADIDATNFTMATLITALEGQGFKIVDESDNVSTQTT